MADPGIFQFIGESVDAALASFITGTVGSVIDAIMPVAILGATIYFSIMGYMMIAGRLQNPAGAVVLQGIKFIAISALALSVGGYSSWVIDVIRGLEEGLASAFSGTAGTGGALSVYSTVDSTLGEGWDIAADLWEQAGNRGLTEVPMAIGEYVNAFVIGIATLVVGLPAGAMIVVAKATLTLLLGIGPLFVMCLMFPITARWFDQWFAQVMTAILTIALVAAVAAFMMKIFGAFIGSIDITGEQNTLFTALTLTVLSIVILLLLYRVGGLAAGLAGGMSAAAITFGQMAAGAASVGGAPGRMGRGANDMLNPVSNRLDPQTGLQTSSRRLEHMAMGRTVFAPNPAYRNALQERLRSTLSNKPNAIKENKGWMNPRS